MELFNTASLEQGLTDLSDSTGPYSYNTFFVISNLFNMIKVYFYAFPTIIADSPTVPRLTASQVTWTADLVCYPNCSSSNS